MEKKKREEFIDIAKGIAILCVIIGHTWKNAYPADKRLMVFIYSFHMPLFFILSGWCLKSTDVKISSVIVKKIKQLVVPYVVINFIRTMIMSPELFLKTWKTCKSDWYDLVSDVVIHVPDIVSMCKKDI